MLVIGGTHVGAGGSRWGALLWASSCGWCMAGRQRKWGWQRQRHRLAGHVGDSPARHAVSCAVAGRRRGRSGASGCLDGGEGAVRGAQHVLHVFPLVGDLRLDGRELIDEHLLQGLQRALGLVLARDALQRLQHLRVLLDLQHVQVLGKDGLVGQPLLAHGVLHAADDVRAAAQKLHLLHRLHLHKRLAHERNQHIEEHDKDDELVEDHDAGGPVRAGRAALVVVQHRDVPQDEAHHGDERVGDVGVGDVAGVAVLHVLLRQVAALCEEQHVERRAEADHEDDLQQHEPFDVRDGALNDADEGARLAEALRKVHQLAPQEDDLDGHELVEPRRHVLPLLAPRDLRGQQVEGQDEDDDSVGDEVQDVPRVGKVLHQGARGDHLHDLLGQVAQRDGE
mmetsp:Transcript_31442/g.79476  ORF Transcript_31442/g.79476 Transcript_31442/m.79476 type:complete len:395 (+) Transcript_31442:106-1290(+)